MASCRDYHELSVRYSGSQWMVQCCVNDVIRARSNNVRQQKHDDHSVCRSHAYLTENSFRLPHNFAVSVSKTPFTHSLETAVENLAMCLAIEHIVEEFEQTPMDENN